MPALICDYLPEKFQFQFSGNFLSNMWDSETESVGGRDYGNGVLGLSKQSVKTDGFELKGNSWYV